MYGKPVSESPQPQEGVCSSEVKKAEDPIIGESSRHKVEPSLQLVLFAGLRLEKSPLPISLSFNIADRAFSRKLFPSAASFCEQPTGLVAAEAQPLEPPELVLQLSTVAFRWSGAQGRRARSERRLLSSLFLSNNRPGTVLRAPVPRTFGNPRWKANTSGLPRKVPPHLLVHKGGTRPRNNRPFCSLPDSSAPHQRTAAASSRRPWAGAPRAAERCGRRAGAPPTPPATCEADAPPPRPPPPPAGSSVLAPASPAALAYLLSACPWARTAGRLPPGLCEAKAGALLGRREPDNTWRAAPRFWAGVLQRDENGDPHERHFHM